MRYQRFSCSTKRVTSIVLFCGAPIASVRVKACRCGFPCDYAGCCDGEPDCDGTYAPDGIVIGHIAADRMSEYLAQCSGGHATYVLAVGDEIPDRLAGITCPRCSNLAPIVECTLFVNPTDGERYAWAKLHHATSGDNRDP